MFRPNLLASSGRLMLAIIFVFSGMGKLFAPEATQGFIASVGLPFPVLSYLMAVLIELGGGFLLLVGFHARTVALALATFTLLTAVIFHGDFADQNQMIHFMKNIAIAGGLLQVVAFGAGSISVDAPGRRVA